MTEFTNAYFMKKKSIGAEFEKARDERKAEKEELVKSENWKGLDAWNEREKGFLFSYSTGSMKAYWAWKDSTLHRSDAF